MTEFAIHDADARKLEVFAQAFHRLYRDKGPDASMDREEVREVIDLAVDALGQPARDFMALVDPLSPIRAANPDEVEITCTARACDEVKAAVALVSCYRHHEQIAGSELDDAYSTLASSDMEHSPSP
ncbi:hypothetical protein OIU34_20160 [Pararhizobium sp. BT-229]|uniref:hypothetical protein n=1 Tax=Pararhizobium sp. BT-229 TaxID=2986923 RepID=UPI0021F6D1ED|nr:hypothetical protein [Pararhizobium sp. BT-229]MCV9964202.1 hypothetical protein [Pararhizobium sp. BT-229]